MRSREAAFLGVPVRPQELEGKHELHRLTRRDVISLSGDLATLLPVFEAGATIEKFLALGAEGGILDRLLSLSFPSAAAAGVLANLPLATEVALWRLIWDENNISGIVENLSLLGGKVTTALTQQISSSPSPELT